jgi:hypothetical protein
MFVAAAGYLFTIRRSCAGSFAVLHNDVGAQLRVLSVASFGSTATHPTSRRRRRRRQHP